MPLENLHIESTRAWALWKISEDENFLSQLVAPFETSPASVTNPTKRLEFLAGRVLIKNLLAQWSMSFKGLTKDAFGKPFLKNSDYHISLSHSYPYVAAIIDKEKSVGIDLEQPKEKLLRIGPRVLSDDELKDAGPDIIKHCIYWCAKESLIKVHGKKGLTISENLRVNPFSKELQGVLIGRIIVDNKETRIPLEYIVMENFVLVITK
jgi:4'-phosphopantetheinyl transferase